MVNPKNFKQSLATFDKDNIPDKVIKRLNKVAKGEDFAATRAPKAAAILTQWVIAIMQYNKALRQIM